MAVRSSSSILLFLPALFLSTSAASVSAHIGINYGQVANNLPSPSSVFPLLRCVGAGRVKLYDTDARVLGSFAGTDFEFIVGLPDQLVPKVRDPAAALSWIKSNIQPHLPHTKIAAITVGNEILSSNSSLLVQSLVPAMHSIYSALARLGLDQQISVTTTHSLTVLATSFPPSAGSFRRDLLPYITPLINFLNKTDSPFLINAYPFFAYKADPKRVSLNYVLFQPNAGVVDATTGLRYSNMLLAQVDAVVAAIGAVSGAKAVEVQVSETGWPSAGDQDEVGATPENARQYIVNLMKMVAEGKGTPMRPASPLQVFVFALFNENMKPGPASERHYGLFKPDGTPAYDLGVEVPVINSTDKDGGSDDDFSPPSFGSITAGSYLTFSSAKDNERWLLGIQQLGVLGMAIMVLLFI